MAERIAVTGASGFVGRHLVVHAAGSGRDVVGIVRSAAGARAVAAAGGLPAQVGALEPDALAPALAGARAVVHLAQIGAERDGSTYEGVNVEGSRAVVAAARRAGVARVVFLSGLGVARYGMKRRCTNPYFLSKLAAELELFRSGLEVAVLRPSYILGPGGELISELREELAAGEVELVGDGRYRMQPIAVKDAVAAILAAVDRSGPHPAVFDLVGPEPVSYRELVAQVARALGKSGAYRLREIPVAEAEHRASAGGYRRMLPDALDCLLCDEVGDCGPLEALLGGFLTPLDEALAAALRPARRFAPAPDPQ